MYSTGEIIVLDGVEYMVKIVFPSKLLLRPMDTYRFYYLDTETLNWKGIKHGTLCYSYHLSFSCILLSTYDCSCTD